MKCCLSTDVGTWTNCLTFETDPDYSSDAGTGLLSPIFYKRCNAEFYYVGKIPNIRIGHPSLQRRVVLISMVLFTASHRNTTPLLKKADLHPADVKSIPADLEPVRRFQAA